MKVMHHFCGRCGHELKPAAGFCGNCGHSVPGSAGHPSAQAPGAAPQQAPNSPGYAPTITARSVAAQPVAAEGAASAGAAGFPSGADQSTAAPGRPPPNQSPPGAAPPWPGVPPRTPRRPAFLLPLVVGLAVLVAGGGTATGLLLVSHSTGQPTGPDNVVAGPPTSEPPTSTSPPPLPPTQVDIQGMTVGIAAVNTDPDATAVAATLATYFGGIDNRNYKQAWDTYTSVLQGAVPFQPFSNALQTSQDSQVVVQSIQHDANGNIEAHVSFQSQQAGQYGPNQGETCTNWSLDYHMVPAANATSGPVALSYLIDKVTPIGAGHASC
jgi:hypothetical protein